MPRNAERDVASWPPSCPPRPAGEFSARPSRSRASPSCSSRHATAPTSAGLSVGKRFETRLATDGWLGGSAALAPSLGYATVIRSLSQGRATYTMEFDHYARVPEHMVDEALGRTKEEF